MKKILFISLIFGGILIQLNSCSKDDTYWEIKDFQIAMVDKYGISYNSDTIKSNSLYVRLTFNPEYSAVLRRSLPFINEAYAADDEVVPGLKHSISRIIVTSINDFNGIPAGENIEEKMKYCGQASIYGNCTNQTLESFIFNDFQQERPFLGVAFLSFTEKPSIAEHQLTIRFIDSQGKEFVSTSHKFQWK